MTFFTRLALFLLLALAAAASPRIVVERPMPKTDSTQAAPDTLRRFVLDPGAMIYQMQVDSINQVTEDKIRDLIIRLEHKFQDPATEEEVGKLIGNVVMEQQMAILDLQIDRAISSKDTLLLKGVTIALQELIKNSPAVRTALEKSLAKLQQEFRAR
jgi:hypothetical protein